MKLRWPLRLGLVRLSLLAIVVGLVTGLGAVVFRDLIGFIHNLTFLGVFSFDYEANFTPPSPWGALIILVPVVGGQIVTFLITKFAPEARGHGVTVEHARSARFYWVCLSCATDCANDFPPARRGPALRRPRGTIAHPALARASEAVLLGMRGLVPQHLPQHCGAGA